MASSLWSNPLGKPGRPSTYRKNPAVFGRSFDSSVSGMTISAVGVTGGAPGATGATGAGATGAGATGAGATGAAEIGIAATGAAV